MALPRGHGPCTVTDPADTLNMLGGSPEGLTNSLTFGGNAS